MVAVAVPGAVWLDAAGWDEVGVAVRDSLAVYLAARFALRRMFSCTMEMCSSLIKHVDILMQRRAEHEPDRSRVCFVASMTGGRSERTRAW